MKHAYLIIAHKNDYTLQILLKLIDDERNDIFIHMDRKNQKYEFEIIKKYVKKSKIYQIENRNNVVWGDYSQIDTELILLELAIKTGKYDFYHLLSGEDLPLKSQDYIHKFFNENKGEEFVRFEKINFSYNDRVSQYHLLQRLIGKPNSHPFLYSLNYRFLKLQKIFGIRRNKDIQFQKGANWFSITDDLARLVISKKEWIEKIFKFTVCCDEVFLQTIINQTEFKNRLYHKKYDNDLHSIMRLIDWERGTPYIFKIEDKKMLTETDMLFARKFDCNMDREIIDYIAQYILGKNIK